MKTIYAALLVSAFAMPALADPFSGGDHYGPAGKDPYTADSPVAAYRAPTAAVSVPWVQAPWVGATSPLGYVDPRPQELKEQIARNNEHGYALDRQLRAEGGCQANFLPFHIASACNEGTFGDPMGGN